MGHGYAGASTGSLALQAETGMPVETRKGPWVWGEQDASSMKEKMEQGDGEVGERKAGQRRAMETDDLY